MTPITRLCAWGAAICFVVLAVLSKVWIEPPGMVVFDSRFGGYSPADAQALLAAMTPAQSAAYLGLFRALDTLFPILIAATLMLVIWRHASGVTTAVRLAALLGPLAYLGFDLTENALVAQMLRVGPLVSDAMVLQASSFTQGKWICLAVALLLVVWAWRFAPKKGSV